MLGNSSPLDPLSVGHWSGHEICKQCYKNSAGEQERNPEKSLLLITPLHNISYYTSIPTRPLVESSQLSVIGGEKFLKRYVGF